MVISVASDDVGGYTVVLAVVTLRYKMVDYDSYS